MNRPTPRNALMGIVLAFVAAPAPNVTAQDDAAAIARPCVRPTNIDRTKILDNRNILFFMRDETVLHNVLPENCPQLQSEGRFAYDKAGNRLCVESYITVVIERSINGPYLPGPVCRLGMFVPVTEDEVEDLLALSTKSKRTRKSDASRGPIEAKPVELPPDASSPTPESAAPEAASQ